MNKQPFIINIDETTLPNLAEDEAENFGIVFDKTNEWLKENDIISLLLSINKKMDSILLYLNKNGRE